MPLVQINLRLPAELIKRIDEVRGDVPRNRWLLRAVERALGADESRASGGDPRRREAPAEQPQSRTEAFRAASQRRKKS